MSRSLTITERRADDVDEARSSDGAPFERAPRDRVVVEVIIDEVRLMSRRCGCCGGGNVIDGVVLECGRAAPLV